MLTHGFVVLMVIGGVCLFVSFFGVGAFILCVVCCGIFLLVFCFIFLVEEIV